MPLTSCELALPAMGHAALSGGLPRACTLWGNEGPGRQQRWPGSAQLPVQGEKETKVYGTWQGFIMFASYGFEEGNPANRLATLEIDRAWKAGLWFALEDQRPIKDFPHQLVRWALVESLSTGSTPRVPFPLALPEWWRGSGRWQAQDGGGWYVPLLRAVLAWARMNQYERADWALLFQVNRPMGAHLERALVLAEVFRQALSEVKEVDCDLRDLREYLPEGLHPSQIGVVSGREAIARGLQPRGVAELVRRRIEILPADLPPEVEKVHFLENVNPFEDLSERERSSLAKQVREWIASRGIPRLGVSPYTTW